MIFEHSILFGCELYYLVQLYSEYIIWLGSLILEYLWTLAPIARFLAVPIRVLRHVHEMVEAFCVFVVDFAEPDRFVWRIGPTIHGSLFGIGLANPSACTLHFFESDDEKENCLVKELWVLNSLCIYFIFSALLSSQRPCSISL